MKCRTRVTVLVPIRMSDNTSRVAAVLNAPGSYRPHASAQYVNATGGGYGGGEAVATGRVRYRRATTLTATASASRVGPGRAVRLSGRLRQAYPCTSADHPPMCDVTHGGYWRAASDGEVRIAVDPSGPAGSRVVTTVSTDGDGRYHATVRPSRTGTWRARYPGDTGRAPSRSPGRRIVVA